LAKELHIRIDSHIGLLIDVFGFIWPGFTAYELEFRLQELPNPEKLVLHVNSRGGDVDEGIAIFNRLLDLKKAGTVVEIINEGMCYSIATFIAMSASKGHLKAREASTWCAHRPWVPDTGGTADDLRRTADELDSYEGIIVSGYASRTGKEKDAIHALLKLDKVVSSTEALNDGWIDAIIPNGETAPSPVNKANVTAPLAFYRAEKQQQPLTNMTEQEQDGIVTKVVASIKGLFKKDILALEDENQAVAATTVLADESIIYHEGELAVDTAVFTDEERTTAVADGSHELQDARSITVAGGLVTEIIAAPTGGEETAALAVANSRIQELEALLETSKAAAARVKGLEAVAAKVPDLEKKVADLKAKVPGGGHKETAPAQSFTTTGTPEPEKLTKEKNAFKALAKK